MWQGKGSQWYQEGTGAITAALGKQWFSPGAFNWGIVYVVNLVGFGEQFPNFCLRRRSLFQLCNNCLHPIQTPQDNLSIRGNTAITQGILPSWITPSDIYTKRCCQTAKLSHCSLAVGSSELLGCPFLFLSNDQHFKIIWCQGVVSIKISNTTPVDIDYFEVEGFQ